MPRHQDNVDVIISGNSRQSRYFSGTYTLVIDDDVEDPDPAWWHIDFEDNSTRFFECTESYGKLSVYANMMTGDKIASAATDEFGTSKYLTANPTTVSRFSWESYTGHDITLDLSAFDENGNQVDIHCVDRTPADKVWTFELRLAGNAIGKYVVDYSSARVASFTVHEIYSL